MGLPGAIENIVIIPGHQSRHVCQRDFHLGSLPVLAISVEMVLRHLRFRLRRELMLPSHVPLHLDPPFEERDILKDEIDVVLVAAPDEEVQRGLFVHGPEMGPDVCVGQALGKTYRDRSVEPVTAEEPSSPLGIEPRNGNLPFFKIMIFILVGPHHLPRYRCIPFPRQHLHLQIEPPRRHPKYIFIQRLPLRLIDARLRVRLQTKLRLRERSTPEEKNRSEPSCIFRCDELNVGPEVVTRGFRGPIYGRALGFCIFRWARRRVIRRVRSANAGESGAQSGGWKAFLSLLIEIICFFFCQIGCKKGRYEYVTLGLIGLTS